MTVPRTEVVEDFEATAARRPGRDVGRSIAIVTLGNLTPLLASLVTAPLLARALGAEGRGLVAAATAPLLVASAALTLGMPDAVTYFVARRVRTLRTLGLGLLVVCIAGPLGSALIASLSHNLAGDHPDISGLISTVGLMLTPALVALVVRGYARALQAWFLVASDQCLASVFRVGALGVLLATGSLTIASAAWVLAIGNCVGIIAYLGLLGRYRRRSPTPDSDLAVGRHAAQLTRFGLGAWIGSAAGVVLARLDQVLFLPLSSAEQLGIYIVAVSLADMVRTFNAAVRDVVFSVQSAQNDDESLGRAARLSTIITAGVGVTAVLVGWGLVPLAFGPEFASVTAVLAVVLVGTVIGNPGSVAAAGMTARGRPILRSIAILSSVVLNIVLLVILLPTMGAMGAAIASMVANAICGLFVLVLAYLVFGMKPAMFLRIRRDDFVFLGQKGREFAKRAIVVVRKRHNAEYSGG
ncbi:lipopolysaccharide biosynthesis protein [Gordonia sp. KTR9]|uniref:lipopolysaccharide biosynthesis protein n=1 Tax=Gordonia sp. KTR9 TaxID=337191 RepID=UPI00027DDCAE|nr:lipopolysaccharide biosynthesis protein [Gordonia sp. KTR9]AFR47698.1 membrane protein involved in the export of O-antigen and teichoic acid [Gordonia sp. KTR9]